jgi:hypothetical protein
VGRYPTNKLMGRELLPMRRPKLPLVHRLKSVHIIRY